MIPPMLLKFAGPAVVIAVLSGWALLERSGRLSAKNQVVALEGALNLRDERIREQNRSLQALSTATTAANARSQLLAAMRARENAPLVASIKKLEGVITAGAQEGKDCRDALREWRAGQ